MSPDTEMPLCIECNGPVENHGRFESPILLPDFSCHILRHTFCTRLCESEPNLKVIQSIMGRSDISTTMNIYADCTAEQKQEVLNNLEGRVLIK
ncbi:MAG: tyrosine-type recombinase/integrase [Lachnospiraceae bacterium]|nr:tyrosine-type recombinase/integrase [Lachnospiraceae bacterium]